MRFKRKYKQNFGKLKFQGQFFQDMIAFLYLQNKKDGFYLDIGANDGISGSNTYIFEQIGWNGICIEPQPDVYKILKKYRNCVQPYFAVPNLYLALPQIKICLPPGFSGSDQGNREIQVNA
jgi:hypothetical protein